MNRQYFIVKANYTTKNGDCVLEVQDDAEHVLETFSYACNDRDDEKLARQIANEYINLLKGNG